MTCKEIIRYLKSLESKPDIEGQRRFGIVSKKQLGIRMTVLRLLAKQLKPNHSLAIELWATEYHEARLLAGFIADPKVMDEKLMESWVSDFDNWALCDSICLNVFDKSPIAFQKAVEWSSREKEYEKRAGFALMAALAVHNKKMDDTVFLPLLGFVKNEAGDERNFVKKAVNWALRQIGKRSLFLYNHALQTAHELLDFPSRSARWIAADAIKEFDKDYIKNRVQQKNKKNKPNNLNG